MKITELAIRYPVSAAVVVIMVLLFGLLALLGIPVQLTPTVEEPEISVTTSWPGASPQEIEREIIDEQEDQLKSLEGLIKMESTSSDSRGSITLTFSVGSDNDGNLLRVSNRLEQVPRYPEDADKPVIRCVGANRQAIAWYILLPASDEPFEGDIATLLTFVENNIKPQLERVPGVADANIYGGREQELQVIVDPAELAARGITLNLLATALERENRSFSGGDFSEGKRRYVVRTMGEYRSPEDIEEVVIAVRNGVPIMVGDVAQAHLGYRKPRAETFFLGQQVIIFNAIKESGSNVLEVMEGLREARDGLNRDLLGPRGLRIIQVYDETDYIHSAIGLVRQSLAVGAVLAVLILLAFLRSPSSALVIGVAIPICALGTFLLMAMLDRTVNVISLAGMAFAVGMVLDSSIVVLENIYRHRQQGVAPFQAAANGANEVWGAVLASTLTTVAVFVPVVFIQQEAGQLFRDIAIAISCGVGLSLLVAITVIPSLAARILTTSDHLASAKGVGLAVRFRDWVSDTVYQICGSRWQRILVVLGMTGAAIGLSLLLAPKAEYLPLGNRNLLFGIMQPPPGYSVAQVAEIGEVYAEHLAPLYQAEGAAAEDLPGGGIRYFFFVALNNQAIIGARARDPLSAGELLPVLNEVSHKVPGAFAFIGQASLFARGMNEGRNIDIEISGPQLEQLIGLGGEILGKLQELLPGSQARPIPSLDLGNPEVRIRPHRRRAAELGISNRDLGFVVSALVDGAKASDYKHQGDEIDLRVIAKSGHEQRTHLLGQLPIAAASGEIVSLGSVADISVESGPVQISRIERRRAITIQVRPAEQTPLQEAIQTINSAILGPLRSSGRLGGIYRANLSGSADKLSQTGRALALNFVLALVITYLLLAALFESFLYPFVIMFSVPLAALGGFIGLAVLNLFTYQPLDILTMLGFFILVGTVVNNAILVVHRSLAAMRDEGVAPREAIREATRTRIRPISMSVLTSVFGMLPLILFPGAGSELYRGLGSVVVGGLLVSTVFTLFLIPALFSLMLDARESLLRLVRTKPAP